MSPERRQRPPSELAQSVRAERKRLGLSQLTLGVLAGTSADAVKRCELGYLDRDEVAKATHLLNVMSRYQLRDWGAEMRAWRVGNGLTMVQAGARAGVAWRTWFSWENGRIRRTLHSKVRDRIEALLATGVQPSVYLVRQGGDHESDSDDDDGGCGAVLDDE